MLSYEEFVEKLKTIPAKVGTEGTAIYHDIKLQGDNLTYYRGGREYFEGKHNPLIEKLIVKELYNAYQNLDSVNRDKVRPYISRKQYNPAVAFLKSTGLYDKKGNRIE